MKILFKSATFNNAYWMMGEKIFSMLLGLISISLVARYLGPTSYGELNFAIYFVGLFAILTTLGLDSIIVKMIVQKQESIEKIMFSAIFLKFLGSILLNLIVCIYLIIFKNYNFDYILIFLLISSMYFFKSFDAFEYWIQATHNSKKSSLARMNVTIVTTVLKILAVTLDLGFIFIASIYLIEAILISISLFNIFKKFLDVKIFSFVNLNIPFVKEILKHCMPLIITGILISVYTRVDKVLLGEFWNKEELGIFMAAFTISNMWFFIPVAIINSFKPIVMKLKDENPVAYLKKFNQLFTILIYLNLSCMISVYLFKDTIIKVLYGEHYASASQLLVIIIWSGFFSIIGIARSVWLICENKQKYSIFFVGVGAILSLCLNILLIPLYGAKAVAINMVIVEFISCMILPLFFKETRTFTILFVKSFHFKYLK